MHLVLCQDVGVHTDERVEGFCPSNHMLYLGDLSVEYVQPSDCRGRLVSETLKGQLS